MKNLSRTPAPTAEETSSRLSAKPDLPHPKAKSLPAEKPTAVAKPRPQRLRKPRKAPSSLRVVSRQLPAPEPEPTTEDGEPANIASKPTLKNWDPEEQPRERLQKYGPETLASSELIAILLRSGTPTADACSIARTLLHTAGGSIRRLGSRDWRDLAKTHGVGPVKAVTLMAALELGRRRELEKDVERPKITTSNSSFALLGPLLADLPHEECWALLLNNDRRVLATERLSSGGLDGTVVDVRALIALALRCDATGVVLAHNHPSGALNPSQADITLTKRLVAAGQLMHIPLLDHLIIAGRRYYSFADEKRLS